jgi:phage-related protein
MAEGFKIADGYLDIEADDTGARRTLRDFKQHADDTVEDTRRSFLKGGLLAGFGFGKGVTDSAGREIERGFTRDVNGRLRDAQGRFAKAGEDSGHGFGAAFRKALSKLMPGGSGGGGGGAGGGLISGLLSGVTGGLGTAVQGLSTAGGMLSNIGGGIATAGGLINTIAMATAMVGLIPIAVSLVGTLLQLSAVLGLLPGLIGFAVAALAPLMIAFKGISGALAAFMSGDMQKFNEELKKLGPNARIAVREMTGLIKPLKEIGKSVTDAFWKPFIGAFTDIGKFLLPTLKVGLTNVASALGRFGAGLLRLLSSNDVVKAFGRLFESTARIIDNVGPSAINLFGTLIGIMEHGLPFVERFFGKIADGMDALSGFLSGSMKSGGFERAMERAFSIMQDLWDLGKSLGKLFLAIFGGEETGEAGQGFIKTLTGVSDQLTAFFKSEDGKEFISNIIDLLHSAEKAIRGFGFAAGFVMEMYNNFIVFFGTMLPNAFHATIDAIVGAAKAVGGWFADAGRAIGNFASSVWGAITGALSAAGNWFGDLGRSIMGFLVGAGVAITNWFQALPGRIMGFLQALPGMVATIIGQMFDRFNFMVGYGIGLIIFAFTVLPGRIAGFFMDLWNRVIAFTTAGVNATIAWFQALPLRLAIAWSTLVAQVSSFISGAWNAAVAWTVNGYHAVIAWIDALPGRISGAWSGLVGMVSGFFSRAKDSATSQTRSMVDSVMGFIHSLPGRVGSVFSGAGSWLYGAGRNIIQGLMDGVMSMVGWAVDKATRAMRSIVDGAKRALGIASPSKVFANEVGRWIPPGIQQGFEARMPNLQKDLARMSSQLTQSVNVAAPNVSVGGGTTIVMIDGEQISARILKPGRVAAANDEGARRRAFLNSARAVTT